MEYFGSEYGGWPLITSLVDPESVVLSFGLGADISFDLEVIRRIGCRVIGFDPTPKSIAWLSEQTLPEQFQYFEVGLAVETGVLTFNAPENPAFASYSTVHSENGAQRVELPVKDLATIIEDLQIDYIDVLKMDIEGSENEVVSALANSTLRPGQILVEFHHRIHRTPFNKTRDAIQSLERIGYKLFFISSLGDEFAFVHDEAVRKASDCQ